MNHKLLSRVTTVILMTNLMLPLCSRADVVTDYGFDIVDTFDNLKNWKGKAWSGSKAKVCIEKDAGDLPVKQDGSPSIWTGYTHFNSSDAAGDWIADHGSGNVWRGSGKSMRMDIGGGTGGTPGYGPERFITYFGNGSRNSGYSDVYIFFMAKIDPAQFPTEISNGVGKYVAGKPYVYWRSWKFFTVTHGFESTFVHGDADAPRDNYGWHQWNTHLRPIDGKMGTKIEGWYEGSDSQSGVDDNWVYSSSPIAGIPLGEWFGIEVHYSLGTAGTNSGKEEIWIYDQNGNGTLYMSKSNLYVQHSKLKGDKINKFWIGGNNSNEYIWGPTMVPEYYIDDFIVNGSRIGPTYFSLIAGKNPPKQALPAPQINKINIQN